MTITYILSNKLGKVVEITFWCCFIPAFISYIYLPFVISELHEMHWHFVLTTVLVFKLFLLRALSVRFVVGNSRDVLWNPATVLLLKKWKTNTQVWFRSTKNRLNPSLQTLIQSDTEAVMNKMNGLLASDLTGEEAEIGHKVYLRELKVAASIWLLRLESSQYFFFSSLSFCAHL